MNLSPEQRRAFGVHYTSDEHIFKVLRPLFLDSLAAAEDARTRIEALRIFDPACGSGNFLVAAYRELRRIGGAALRLDQLYGIEIDASACEAAHEALRRAEREMDVELGVERAAPGSPTIVHGNATRLDWEAVCPKDGEVYVIGNPPYVGSSLQTAAQKADFVAYFGATRYPKNLDYTALWFLKGARYVADGRASLAFVTTNSVAQGDHVGLMWPSIFAEGVEVSFAHQSFKWATSTRGRAGVTCAVVGLSARPSRPRLLFARDGMRHVANIGPYLLPTEHNTIVHQRRTPLSALPPMVRGNQPTDGGHLLLSAGEREAMIDEDPRAEAFIRRYVGATELLRGTVRYCLWIADDAAAQAWDIVPIAHRLERIRAMRRLGSVPARAMADRPHRFVQRPHVESPSIIVPIHSSERRRVIPMDFLDAGTIISNAANAIYDAEPWLFALLQSRLHTAWVETVGGKIKNDYRYSAVLCFNTFPVPEAVPHSQLTEHARAVLAARAAHADRPLGDLYLPGRMPADLRAAHEALDATVDELYGLVTPATDEARLERLFSLYESMS